MKGITNATSKATEVVQNTSKIEIGGTSLQVASDSQPGIMSAADHTTLSTTATRIGTCETTVASKQDKLTAGTGISISGNTIGLSNVGSSQTVGGATTVPVISADEYGRVTSLSSQTIYPPTTAGTSGQVWMSNGSGAGSWQDAPAGGTWENISVSNLSSTTFNDGDELYIILNATFNVQSYALKWATGEPKPVRFLFINGTTLYPQITTIAVRNESYSLQVLRMFAEVVMAGNLISGITLKTQGCEYSSQTTYDYTLGNINLFSNTNYIQKVLVKRT